MPAPNRCHLSDVPKQEQILLDRGQRAVNPRLTKVNGPSKAGPVTVNRTPPRPGRSGDDPQTKLKVPPLLRPGPTPYGQRWVPWDHDTLLSESPFPVPMAVQTTRWGLGRSRGGTLSLICGSSPLRSGRGGVRFTVTGPASDGPLTLVKRGFTAL